jgi:hypothetical protein
LLGEEPPVVVFEVGFFRNSGVAYTEENFALIRHFPETTSVVLYTDRCSAQSLTLISSMPNLDRLELNCDRLPDSESAFGSVSSVTQLWLESMTLDDDAFRSVCRLKQLTQLSILDSQVTASATSLRELQNLSRLSVLLLKIDGDMYLRLPDLPQVGSLILPWPSRSGRIFRQPPRLRKIAASSESEFPGCIHICYHRRSSFSGGLKRGPLMNTRQLIFLDLLCLLVCGLVVLSIASVGVQRQRAAARGVSCADNLKKLGLAIHNYHSAYKQLPMPCGGSAAAEDAELWQNNQDRLSPWVALLPFAEEQALWEKISNPMRAGSITFPSMGPAPWYDPEVYMFELESPAAASRRSRTAFSGLHRRRCSW